MSIESARQFVIAHVEKFALAICLLLLALSVLFFMVLKDSSEGPRINLTRKITAVQQQTKEQTLADALTHAKTKKAPEDNWIPRTVYHACMNHEFDESGLGLSVGTTIEGFVKAWEDANPGKVVTQPGPSAIHLGDGQWLVRRDLEPAGQRKIVHAFLYNPRLDALELLSEDAKRLFSNFQAPALERFAGSIDASPDPWPGREYVQRLIAPKEVTVKLPGEILPVKGLELVQGRGVTEETEEDVKKYRIAKGRRIEISDIVWISGKATFDLSKQ
ncbi:MAG: hypothetical protein QF662_06065, partial [Phycisphaerae bacterium]|nr:hypothetical protein [Phycisphaerae bacterium]